MGERARIGPIELLMYAIVTGYIAAAIYTFQRLLQFQYGAELIIIAAGLAAFLWLAGLTAVLPGIVKHLAVWDAARGVSKAGDGIREWGRSRREQERNQGQRREDEADRWYR